MNRKIPQRVDETVFKSAKNGAMKIIPTKLTQNVRMKQVGDADTQNDPVAHARARHDRTQKSTVARAGAKKNSNSHLKIKST